MKFRGWSVVGLEVLVIIGTAVTNSIFGILLMATWLVMFTAMYFVTEDEYERHSTEHPISKDYMRGVQEGMRMGYAQRMMEEKGESDE